MPKGGTVQLRIYCICGQKMKVSESMYGRPGKCIACRQKIRIPRPDEIPPDTSEIYLKDHPELLRKVPKPVSAVDPAPVATPDATFADEGEEIALEDERPSGGAPALEPLEPLRNLCSLEYSVARKLTALTEYENEKGRSHLRDELQTFQGRIERARAELDEQLRQRLMEVAIELANTHEKIASSGLAARVGEVGFHSFREKVEKLRRRREALEKLQHNLRGWLTCRDPHSAGGFIDLPFDQIPQEGIRLNLAGDLDSGAALVDGHVESIRQALFARERAERKLSETERLQAGSSPVAGLAEIRADGRAEKRRADAAVRFYRARLEQLKNDYDSDIQAVASQLDLARGRVQVGELNRPQFDELEADLDRAKTDMAKAVDLLVRAMNANTVRDVPHVRGTFLARLARPVGQQGIEADSWITWGAALALIASTLLPAVGVRSALSAFNTWHTNFPSVHWFLTVPVLSAVLAALAGLIPVRALRGLVVLGLGAAMCIGAAIGLHETTYTAGDIGHALREGGLVRPGIVMFFLAGAAVILSGSAALAKVKVGWLAFVPVILGTGVALTAAFTDAWGYFVPAPEIGISAKDATPSAPNGVVQVTLTNAGHREMLVVNDTGGASAGAHSWDKPSMYYYAIERRIGQESWRPQRAQELRSSSSNSGILKPGQSVEHQYALPPGDYRVALMADVSERNVVSSAVTIEEPPAPPATTPPADAPLAPATGAIVIPGADPTAAGNPATAPATPGASGTPTAPLYVGLSMELKGLVSTPGREPQFSVLVRLPDGTSRERHVSIGGSLQDKWTVREFNPQLSTVTITNGETIYILRRGERVDIAPDK